MTDSDKPEVLPSAQIDIGQMSNMYVAPNHYVRKIEYLNSEAPAFDLRRIGASATSGWCRTLSTSRSGRAWFSTT